MLLEIILISFDMKQDKTRVFNADCSEEWIGINGFSGRYLISSHGRIKSLRDNRIMKPLKTTTGYYQIQFSENGIRSQFRIHRLVADAFISNPNNKPEINHKDGNKLNNAASNLEWCTKSENAKHAYDSGLNGRMRPIVCLNLNGDVVKKYKSAREAEEDGYANQLIAKCCLGQRKSHKDKIWKYA